MLLGHVRADAPVGLASYRRLKSTDRAPGSLLISLMPAFPYPLMPGRGVPRRSVIADRGPFPWIVTPRLAASIRRFVRTLPAGPRT